MGSSGTAEDKLISSDVAELPSECLGVGLFPLSDFYSARSPGVGGISCTCLCSVQQQLFAAADLQLRGIVSLGMQQRDSPQPCGARCPCLAKEELIIPATLFLPLIGAPCPSCQQGDGETSLTAWHHRGSEVGWEEQEANEEMSHGRKGRADQRLIDLSPAH